ncbi:heterokaryon incompatibility protein-domain-containing protein [Xylaria scruposa]|nr:heterokaryon incompatibility protein-domain-containing protein [Xylaria scruposa]
MDSRQISQYLYQTLPSPQHYIRLLEIRSAPDDGMIQCELSTWQIEVAPPYYAISYTWGDPKSASFIKLNGRDIQVRENCHYVLRQVYQHKRSQYYWIDSLCINQNNHYEKGLQVAIMGDIYRNAEHVMGCVGHHEDDSFFLFGILNQKSLLFARVSETCPRFGDIRSDMQREARARHRESSRAILKWKLSLPFASRKRLLEAFHKFSRRPYFLRVWTLQELFLAKRITICCGQDSCSGEALDGFDKAVKGDHKDTRLGRLMETIEDKLERLPLERLPVVRRFMSWYWYDASDYPYQTTRRYMGEYGVAPRQPFTHLTAFTSQRSLSVWEAIQVASDLECYDPRDRLYGTLSLVDWTGIEKPMPNYDSDIYDLALDTLRLCALCIRQEIGVGPQLDYMGQPTHPQYDRQGALHVASFIINNFKLAKQSSAKFSASIQQRQTNHRDMALKTKSRTIDKSLFRYQDTQNWSGSELELFNNRAGRPKYVVLRRRPHLTLYYKSGISTESRGRTKLMLPASTRSGDWLIKGRSISLVIRPRRKNRYDLIGQAVFHDGDDRDTLSSNEEDISDGGDEFTEDSDSGDESMESEDQDFRIFFHLEDLLALAQNSQDIEEMPPGQSTLRSKELLYFTSGLSYAKRLTRSLAPWVYDPVRDGSRYFERPSR